MSSGVISAYNHAKAWGDHASMSRLKSNDSSNIVKQTEVENTLKEMCMRFERSPNPATIQLWSKDIVELGYSPEVVREVCRSIPFKFEKAPTLNQLMALLRPYLANTSVSEDELDNLTQKCLPVIKAKFLSLANEDALTKMGQRVKKDLIACQHFEPRHYEMLFLLSWMRCYFSSDPQKVMDQVSNDLQSDRERLVSTLKRYAREKNII